MTPSSSISRSTTRCSCSTGWAVACGISIRMEWVSSGAVMMKITSNTSMTSISGTILISDIVCVELLESKLPKAMSGSACAGQIDGACTLVHAIRHLLAGGQECKQVVRKGVQTRQVDAIAAHEAVIGQQSRTRDGQAQARHDKRSEERRRGEGVVRPGRSRW